jgi:hypothetical protein
MKGTEMARDKLSETCERIVGELVSKRGSDDIGECGSDHWHDDRLETCEDDWTFDLAMEVRYLRESGKAWWLIAQELGLPGNGCDAKQGRAGAAFARRLWKAAWGETYHDTNVNRETKGERVDRAQLDTSRPYFAADALAPDIISRIRGVKIEWITRLQAGDGLVVSHQETYVHDDKQLIKVKQGPKGRYVEFFEQPDKTMLAIRNSLSKAGPLRSVYLDRIIRVGT